MPHLEPSAPLNSRPRPAARLAMLSCGLLLACVAGCALPPSASTSRDSESGLSPILQRMRQTYPDLAGGRFVSLADFESPGQEKMFRCIGSDGSAGDLSQPSLSILRGRNETGAGGLKARLEDSGQSLLFDGKRSDTLALIRDWRGYAILLMSIYGPSAGVTLELGLESGAADRLRWTGTIPVTPGWGLYRIDLDTVGDHIDLADVRALIWRVLDADGPVDLYLDDIILADNTSYVLGADAPEGGLYVFTRGRRIHVGAGGRFELALADGLIAGWRGGDDANLADPRGLGPLPVTLPPGWHEQPSPPAALDGDWLCVGQSADLSATQRVVEATPFRVVIESRRAAAQFAAPPGAESVEDARSGLHWRYVIYPSGMVCVLTRAAVAGFSGEGGRAGYAVRLDGRRGFRRLEARAGGVGEEPVQFVLLAREGRDRGDLLWSWPRASDLGWQAELSDADGHRLTVVAGDLEAVPVMRNAHMLRVWPADIDATPEAVSLATDYRNPAAVTTTAGRVLTDVAGDLDHDGYNESDGCHELAADGGVLRFGFDPGPFLRFDNVFRVHQTARRRCWVYARGRLVDDVGRDADGNLMFRVAPVISGPVAVEVHAAAEQAAR